MGTITLPPHDCIKVCANIDSPGQVGRHLHFEVADDQWITEERKLTERIDFTRNLSSRDAGPAVNVLAVLLLPLASLASLIPLSALCELTPLSIPPDSNELAESADVDSDVYV